MKNAWGSSTADELRDAYIRLADHLMEVDSGFKLIADLDLVYNRFGLSKPLIWWQGRRLAAGDAAAWRHGKGQRRGTITGFHEAEERVEIAASTGTTFFLPLDRLIFSAEVEGVAP